MHNYDDYKAVKDVTITNYIQKKKNSVGFAWI